MDNLTISIIGNKIFLEIISELKLFRDAKINFLDNISSLPNKNTSENNIILLPIDKNSTNDLTKVKEKNFPIILITPKKIPKIKFVNNFTEEINMPFRILDLKTKIISLLAKYKYKF
jgi:hypothetical protein